MIAGEARVRDAPRETGAGGPAPAGGDDGDDVIDADFEEA